MAAEEKTKRTIKVFKIEILKPAGDMSWNDLAQAVRDVRYRVFRLANLIVSENYLAFHLWRTGRAEDVKKAKISELNKWLREMLKSEGTRDEDLDRISKTGALPDSICGALSQYKIRGLTSKSKWQDVIKGKAALPTFRLNMAIPIRCDKQGYRRLERNGNGDVELDLMICLRPYPRIILKTGKLNDGQRAILNRLLDNESQSPEGYRQRCFEVKQEERTSRWWLYVTYDFPLVENPRLSEDRIVGVDVGFACPLYAAINNGHARLGWNHFAALGARIRTLQRQTMARRRSMLRGGKSPLSSATARSGHGRNRKLRSIEQLYGKINHAYTTLNHQLSASVVDFAVNNGAGVVQMEDLSGLADVLSGTFLGERWRYHELQQFIEYKAKEQGIQVRRVAARYTSRRCSKCGFIHVEFTRAYRDTHRKNGLATRFECPECAYMADADYNAARNLATVDIEGLIRQQCEVQRIS
ncbi:MAG: transposase [Planctomycetia bacterium]|nr:transposase [Planctomycetia bacterium]